MTNKDELYLLSTIVAQNYNGRKLQFGVILRNCEKF